MRAQPFSSPDPILIEFPVHADNSSVATTTQFRLVREGANVIPSVNGVTGESIQLASSTEMTVLGHDNVQDILILDSSGGPLHVPLRYNGGFRDDVLQIDSANGAGLTIDLVNRDSITDVEFIDIRGTGTNTLLLNRDAVVQNDPFSNRLVVIGDADDLVDIGPGWIHDGVETVEAIVYDRYTHGSATLLVSEAVNPTQMQAGDGQPGNAAAGDSPPAGDDRPRRTDNRAVKFELAPIQSPTPQDESNEAGAPRAASRHLRQVISGFKSSVYAAPGKPFSIDVRYDTDGGASATGLHLRIHYDSSSLTFDALSDVLPDGFSTVQDMEDGICRDEERTVCPGLDGDPATDRYLNVLWIAPEADWPNRPAASTRLLTAHFIANADLWQSNVRFSGHAAAGYDFVATPIGISSASGDVSDDRVVDAMDIDLVAAAIRDDLQDSRFDLTRDGSIDDADRRYLIETIFDTSAGDSNLDGRFDSGDLVSVFQAGKYEDGVPGNAGWAEGDWNGDGDFDSGDLVSAFQAGKYVAAARPLNAEIDAAIDAIFDRRAVKKL